MIPVSNPVVLPPKIIQNEHSAIIKKTIKYLSESICDEILVIANILRQNAHQEYVTPQNKKTLNDVKLLDVEHLPENLKNIANNIFTYLNADPCDESQSALQKDLRAEVIKAVEYCLKYKTSLSEIVDLTCVLDHIDYFKTASDDTLYDTILNQLNDKIDQNYKREIFLDVFIAFSLRKGKPNDKWEELFDKIFHNMMLNVEKLTPFQLSLVAIAVQAAKYNTQEIFDRIKPLVHKKSATFKVNEIVNTLWAFRYVDRSKNIDPSITREAYSQFVDLFKNKLTLGLTDLDASQTIRIAWTFKTMNILDVSFFRAVINKIETEASYLTSLVSITRVEELANITKLLCHTGEVGEPLLQKLLRETARQFNSKYLTKEKLVSITYDVLIKLCQKGTGSYYQHFIKAVLSHLAELNSSECGEKERKMIPIIYEIHQHFSQESDPKIDKFVETLKKLPFLQSETNPETAESRLPKTTQLQLDVQKHLRALLLDKDKMKSEYSFEDYFKLDLAFPDLKLCLEVDGHCHFDERGNPMPKDIIKETLLKIRKWTLVRITHRDWYPYRNENSHYDKLKRERLLSKLSEFPQLFKKSY
jgi:very-short-patch-repair endonuclease